MTAAIRQNLPLYGVAVVLLLLLATAIVLGQRPQRPAMVPAQSGAVAVPLPPELAALPATAEDDAVITSQLAPDDALSQNASVAFAATRLAPAPPFRFRGSEADRMRARECLALAGMAEAGAGDDDQRAVMQVILNRVRHPAFAKTVCGVIFQGSERTTGCQFTFTCDGSLRRTYPEYLWRAARQRADEMLGGSVYQPVGNATHYHTNWVFPWWSPKLDKIAQVRTHLFFRWRGFFGTTNAWSTRYAGGEPNPLALRRNANAVERTGLDLPVTPEDEEISELLGDGGDAADGAMSGAPRSPVPGVHFLVVGPGDRPAALTARAQALCPGSAYCQVYGWSNAAAIPDAVPLSAAARRALRFSFVPAGRGRRETVFFDCGLFPGAPPGTCLPQPTGVRAPVGSATRSPTPTPSASPTPSATANSRLPPGGTLKVDANGGSLQVR